MGISIDINPIFYKSKVKIIAAIIHKILLVRELIWPILSCRGVGQQLMPGCRLIFMNVFSNIGYVVPDFNGNGQQVLRANA